MELVLSLFPGIGLLDRGFEDAGFCVVRGPDLIWGGDIRSFNVPPDKFDGVIGGPPCQDFSDARRAPPTGNGITMLEQFQKVVWQAQPNWWLAENVRQVPDIKIPGYTWQRLDLRASDFGSKQRRLRHVQFGSSNDEQLVIERPESKTGTEPAPLKFGSYIKKQQVIEQPRSATRIEPAAMASDSRPVSELARLQSLPEDFDIPAFKRSELRKAIGNGVPYGMARALAEAVRSRTTGVRLCACGCGRPVTGKQIYSLPACRKRAHDRRKRDLVATPGQAMMASNTRNGDEISRYFNEGRYV